MYGARCGHFNANAVLQLAHDRTTVGRCLRQGRPAPLEQRPNHLVQEDARRRALTEGDVIQRAAIAQQAGPVDDEDVRGGLGLHRRPG